MVSRYHKQLHTFYSHSMVPSSAWEPTYSCSPLKPKLFLAYLQQKHPEVWQRIILHTEFQPVTRQDLLLAHEAVYVDRFLTGKDPDCHSNSLDWTPDFANSVLYTSGSLLAAIQSAFQDPSHICLSPTSGFHHAMPDRGMGFCTFSGQAIAALKMYQECGAVGAWVDMDGHFGNSIEDTRKFNPLLNEAIPPGCNINPSGKNYLYLVNLQQQLGQLARKLLAGQIDYVCVAHGADSHVWDDLQGQCDTESWLAAGRAVYHMLADVSTQLGHPVPVVLCLFGGYREDDYNSVLELHTADIQYALNILTGTNLQIHPQVRKPFSAAFPRFYLGSYGPFHRG